MPTHFNDGIDDNLQIAVQSTFDGGQVSGFEGDKIPQNACARMVNCESFRQGVIETRLGFVSVVGVSTSDIDVLKFYKTPTTEDLMVFSGGKAYTWDNTVLVSLAGFSYPDATKPLACSQLIDKVYVVGGGNDHLWQYDGSAWSENKSPDTYPCPSLASLLITHTNRIVASGFYEEPDAIYYSTILPSGKPEFQPSVWSHKIGADGQKIVAIHSWVKFLMLVFKEQSIYVVDVDPTATSASAFTVDIVNNGIGCVAPRSVVSVGDDVFFLSVDGVRSVKSTYSETQYGMSLSLSTPIRDVIDRINWDYAYNACGVFKDNKYLLAIPVDGATKNNKVIVWNTLLNGGNGGWQGEWDGINVNCWDIGAFGRVPQLFTGSQVIPNKILDHESIPIADEDGEELLDNSTARSAVLAYSDYVPKNARTLANYSDAGVYVNTKFETQAYNFGDDVSPKTGDYYELTLKHEFNDGARIKTRTALDEENFQTFDEVEADGNGFTLPIIFPSTFGSTNRQEFSNDLMRLGEFNTLKFEVETRKGRLLFNKIKLGAYSDTIDKDNTNDI